MQIEATLARCLQQTFNIPLPNHIQIYNLPADGRCKSNINLLAKHCWRPSNNFRVRKIFLYCS